MKYYIVQTSESTIREHIMAICEDEKEALMIRDLLNIRGNYIYYVVSYDKIFTSYNDLKEKINTEFQEKIDKLERDYSFRVYK
jgi:hypothetical protein